MGKPALLGALMIGSGAIVASYTTTQWHLYVAFGLMMGLLGQSNLFSPMVANVSHWFSRNRGMAIGIVLSGQTLAGAIWPPIFRYFNDSIGWRGTFFWYGVFALTVMVPVSLVLRRRPPAQPAALHRANQSRGEEGRHAPGRSELSVPSRHSGRADYFRLVDSSGLVGRRPGVLYRHGHAVRPSVGAGQRSWPRPGARRRDGGGDAARRVRDPGLRRRVSLRPVGRAGGAVGVFVHAGDHVDGPHFHSGPGLVVCRRRPFRVRIRRHRAVLSDHCPRILASPTGGAPYGRRRGIRQHGHGDRRLAGRIHVRSQRVVRRGFPRSASPPTWSTWSSSAP